MKNLRKMAILMVFTICLIVPSLAKAESFKTLPGKTDVDKTKAFTIKFSQYLAFWTINNDTVYVLDKNGTKVDISATGLSSDGDIKDLYKTVTITPKAAYAAGETYTLYVTEGVKSISLKDLKTPVKSLSQPISMQFTVKTNVDTQVPISTVTLSKYSATLTKGQAITLTATVAPSNATNKTVKWTTSNSKVATVSSTGTVKAIGTGNAKITVTTNNSKSATCTVTVTANNSAGIYENATVIPSSLPNLFYTPELMCQIGEPIPLKPLKSDYIRFNEQYSSLYLYPYVDMCDMEDFVSGKNLYATTQRRGIYTRCKNYLQTKYNYNSNTKNALSDYVGWGQWVYTDKEDVNKYILLATAYAPIFNDLNANKVQTVCEVLGDDSLVYSTCSTSLMHCRYTLKVRFTGTTLNAYLARYNLQRDRWYYIDKDIERGSGQSFDYNYALTPNEAITDDKNLSTLYIK